MTLAPFAAGPATPNSRTPDPSFFPDEGTGGADKGAQYMGIPTWRSRTPRPRPEQRPTVNVAAVGISYAVPQMHHHGSDNWLEIVPGITLHGNLDALDRITREAHAAVQLARKRAKP